MGFQAVIMVERYIEYMNKKWWFCEHLEAPTTVELQHALYGTLVKVLGGALILYPCLW